MGHVFSRPSLKFRTSGFPQYGFKRQAPSSSARRLPDPMDDSSPIPTYVVHPGQFAPALGSANIEGVDPPPCAGTPDPRRAPPGPRGPRSGEVLLSSPSSLVDLIRQSGHLCPTSQAYLVIGTVFGIQGSSCLVSRPSGLSRMDRSELPPSASAGRSPCAIPSCSRGALAIGRIREILGISNLAAPQLLAGVQFRRLVRSLSLRPF
jgi:hypothetical protein